MDENAAQLTARTVALEKEEDLWYREVTHLEGNRIYGTRAAVATTTNLRSTVLALQLLEDRLEIGSRAIEAAAAARSVAAPRLTVHIGVMNATHVVEAVLDILIECTRPSQAKAASFIFFVAVLALAAKLRGGDESLVAVAVAVGAGADKINGGSLRVDVGDLASDRDILVHANRIDTIDKVVLHLLLRPDDPTMALRPVVIHCAFVTRGLAREERPCGDHRERVYLTVAGARAMAKARGQDDVRRRIVAATKAALQRGDLREAYLWDHRLALLDQHLPVAGSSFKRRRNHDAILGGLVDVCTRLETDADILATLLTSSRTVPVWLITAHAARLTVAIVDVVASPQCVHFRGAGLDLVTRLFGATAASPGLPKMIASHLGFPNLCLTAVVTDATDAGPGDPHQIVAARALGAARSRVNDIRAFLRCLRNALAYNAHLGNASMRIHFRNLLSHDVLV